MNRATLLTIFFVITSMIVLSIGLYLNYEMSTRASQTNLFEYFKERTDIIISDRNPLGCFIPPTTTESNFSNIKTNLKNENETLWNYCFNLGNGNYVTWSMLNLSYGIKVNGYCYDCSSPSCLCLNEPFGYFLEDRRNLDFGEISTQSIGKLLDKQLFSEVRGQPSIFVVERYETPKLSLYAGIKLTGNRSLVDAVGALYNGTTSITNFVRVSSSCYDRKWTCYENCRSSQSLDICKKNCNCLINLRKYLDNPLTMCKNYCEVDFSGDISFCKGGCNYSHDRLKYKKCYIKIGNNTACSNGLDCGGPCNESLEHENLCYNLNFDEKKGCKKFFEFLENLFEISTNYTVFKIGDIDFLPSYSSYRGLALAKVNLTIRELHPGQNCYNINKYECYYICCDEVCEYSNKRCKTEDHRCIDEKEGSIGKCEKKCNCSTTTRLDNEDPFVLCKNFCVSRDGYYSNKSEIEKCQQGCYDAVRNLEKGKYYSSGDFSLDYLPGSNNLEVVNGEIKILDESVCNGPCKYDNVHIHSGGVITTNIGKKLILEVGALIIDSGGKIDVSGKGDNSAGRGGDGSGSNSLSNSGVLGSGGGGGGYGSRGGKGGDDGEEGGFGGNTYGSEDDPQDLGSPGGDGNLANLGGGYGGLGGGAVIIRAEKLILKGEILANGHDGCDGGNNDCGGGIIHNGKHYCNQSSSCHTSTCYWETGIPNSDGSGGGGGGSGGTVNIIADSSLFEGKIEAKGGNGGNDINGGGWDGSGGGGGGGRVKILYTNLKGTISVNVSGGKPGCARDGSTTGALGGMGDGTLNIKLDPAYTSGYDFYVNLTNLTNIISSSEPYIYRNLYKNVYSNLIYILDWNSSTNWTYPYDNNWSLVKTPNLTKRIELNEALKIIKDII